MSENQPEYDVREVANYNMGAGFALGVGVTAVVHGIILNELLLLAPASVFCLLLAVLYHNSEKARPSAGETNG